MSGVADQQTRDDGMALGHPRAASGGANTQRAVPERPLPWVKIGESDSLVAAFAAAAGPSPP